MLDGQKVGRRLAGIGGSSAGGLELPHSRPEVQRNTAAAAVAKIRYLALQAGRF